VVVEIIAGEELHACEEILFKLKKSTIEAFGPQDKKQKQ
jgi:hypothetical protein